MDNSIQQVNQVENIEVDNFRLPSQEFLIPAYINFSHLTLQTLPAF
jgi:hypothetical protein